MEIGESVPVRKAWRLSPALALWLLSPIFGELVSGSTPINEYLNPLVIILFGMLYGSGALLIREFVIRFRKGWISLLLLGMAYGMFEEGLMVRSFFDPNWVDLGKLGVYGRVFGVNWFWTEELIIFHALISVAASIVFIEMLFPDRRREPWLGKRGLILNGFLFLATLPIGFLIDDYRAPWFYLILTSLVIFIFVAAAWFIPGKLKEKSPRQVPRPRRFWWAGFLGTTAYFIFIFATSDHGRPHFIASMIILAVFCLLMQWLILRWNGNGHHWDDRHRLALIIGAQCFFLILGPLTTGSQVPVLYFTSPVFILLFWLAYRKVDARVKGERNENVGG